MHNKIAFQHPCATKGSDSQTVMKDICFYFPIEEKLPEEVICSDCGCKIKRGRTSFIGSVQEEETAVE